MTAGFLVGSLTTLVVPPSPDDPKTVTWFACAAMKAWRRFCSDAKLLNEASPAAKLC
jgi:hypothetical protein